MAAISSSLHPHFLQCHPSFQHLHGQGPWRIKNPSIISCKNNGAHQQIQWQNIFNLGWQLRIFVNEKLAYFLTFLTDNSAEARVECVQNRRGALFQGVLASFVFPLVALAAETDFSVNVRVYTDDALKFKITIPEDWQVGNGEGDGVRLLTAFVPPEASSSNVSLLITGLGADYTKLESFGKVDAFAETLVSGLDRSWQRPPGVAAKLINSKSANGLYYIEYTLQNPGESRRNLVTVLGVANNGIYNRLYTLTGQFFDEEEETFGIKIRKAVSSFRLI